MPIYGQTWFLSIVSGILAVLLYHLCAPSLLVAPNASDTSDASVPPPPAVNTTMYLAVFVVVAVLVYGSFLVANNTGTCRFIDAQPDIQTGGRPPF